LERQRLEGTWVATAVTVDGEECADEDLAKVKLTIDNGQGTFTLVLPKDEWSGNLGVGVSYRPQRMSFVVSRPRPGVRLGIYESEKDSLKICVNADPASDRIPAYFTAEKGSRQTLIVLKRQKKEP
jgi:uncharacterized protein (TIGR03067 family)